MTTRRTYPLWNGCEWTFEEIVEDLTGLVKHILLLTTPQEQIQDAMQEVWLKLLERLQVNPELLRDAPGLNNPGYTDSQKRTFLAQRLAWDGRDRSWGPHARTCAEQEICETDLFGEANELRKNPYGIDTLKESHAFSRQWVEETDLRIDLEKASETYLRTIRKCYLPKYAMAMLCLWHGVPFAAGAMVLGKAPNTLSEAATDCRLALRELLAEYAAV